MADILNMSKKNIMLDQPRLGAVFKPKCESFNPSLLSLSFVLFDTNWNRLGFLSLARHLAFLEDESESECMFICRRCG